MSFFKNFIEQKELYYYFSGENLGNVGASLSASMLVRNTNGVVEDDVDLQLWKMDGKVKRKRDEKL